MIRVFQVLECGGPGGTGNQVAALCRSLDGTRFETTLVYGIRPGSTAKDFEALARGASRYVHVPFFTREIAPLKDLQAFLALYRLFKDARPDIVHAHSSKAGVLARLAARAAKVPRIIYSPRGYSFLQQDRSAAMRAVYWLIESALAPLCETAAVSPGEAALADRFPFKSKSTVVADAFLGDPSLRRDENSAPGTLREVCALGRAAFARNPEAFSALAENLTRHRDRVRCIWIGDGEERSKLGERVMITGWLSPDAALRRLMKASVLVHYSRWDAMPNAVIEAMALGIPVVVSDNPGNRDAVEDGVSGYVVQDEQQLLERVLRLLDDPVLSRTLGAAGRARVEREFSLTKMIARFESLYSQVRA